MTYAVIEIMVLLFLAAAVGVAVGFFIGTLRTLALRHLVRQRRSKADLHHRLVEAQQAIGMLERTIAAAQDEADVVVGTRLSERVRQARAEQIEVEASDVQPVA